MALSRTCKKNAQQKMAKTQCSGLKIFNVPHSMKGKHAKTIRINRDKWNETQKPFCEICNP